MSDWYFLRIWLPPASTLFPYTTLFRSGLLSRGHPSIGVPQAADRGPRPRVPDGLDHHARSEEHTSELQSPMYLVCRLLLEKKKVVNVAPLRQFAGKSELCGNARARCCD